MTAEIINFRQARKRRAREAKAAQAAENRVRFGRARSERELNALNEARARLVHEAHRREMAADAPAEDAPAAAAPQPQCPEAP